MKRREGEGRGTGKRKGRSLAQAQAAERDGVAAGGRGQPLSLRCESDVKSGRGREAGRGIEGKREKERERLKRLAVLERAESSIIRLRNGAGVETKSEVEYFEK